MFKFEQLDVWKFSVDYVNRLTTIGEKLPSIYRYSLGSQLIRAAISILNNIAEATGRRHGAESENLFNVAKGSTYETVSMLIFMKERALLPIDQFNELYERANRVSGMLSGLIKAWRPRSLSLSRSSIRPSAGFGLLEVLLSASILALIAGATIGLAGSSVKTALLGANRTTATQLAQQGVELVRQMRDTTYLDGTANRWNQQPGQENSDLPDCSVSCSLVGPSAAGHWALASSPASETIAVSTGTAPTTFTRSIQLKPIPWYGCPGGGSSCSSSSVPTIPNDSSGLANSSATIAYQVVSTVSWFQNGRTITVQASTFLTDWRAVQ